MGSSQVSKTGDLIFCRKPDKPRPPAAFDRCALMSRLFTGRVRLIHRFLLDSPPVYRTLVEWLVSMVVEHPRGAARLGGISNAAVVV